MDMVKLVENGTYKKEQLSERDEAFVEGMEYIRDNVIVKEFFSQSDCDCEFSDTFGRITKEIIDSAIDCMRDMALTYICEAIVSFADKKECNDEQI